MIAINLQTSFITPPFGFALFLFARRSAPGSGHIGKKIYRGVIPFVGLQLLMLLLLACMAGTSHLATQSGLCRLGTGIRFLR